MDLIFSKPTINPLPSFKTQFRCDYNLYYISIFQSSNLIFVKSDQFPRAWSTLIGRDHLYVNSDYNSLLNVTQYLGRPDVCSLLAKPAHNIELRSITSKIEILDRSGGILCCFSVHHFPLKAKPARCVPAQFTPCLP